MERYTIDFDDVWPECGYSQKVKAVQALGREFREGEDFCFTQGKANEGRGGHNRTVILLTPEAAIEFRKRARTETAHSENVSMLSAPPKSVIAEHVRRTFSTEEIAALAIIRLREDNHLLLDENGRLQLQIEEARPKLEVYEAVMDSRNDQPISRVAKALGWGPIKLFAKLREDRVLRKDNTPSQDHINAGRFRVVAKPIQKGAVSTTYMQTFVTAKGIEWLSQHYSREGATA